MQYDYKALSLGLKWGGLSELLVRLPLFQACLKYCSGDGPRPVHSLIVQAHCLLPRLVSSKMVLSSLFTRLTSRHLSAVLKKLVLCHQQTCSEHFPQALENVPKRTVPCHVVQWQQCWTSWSFPSGCFRFSTHLTRYILGYLKNKVLSGKLIGLSHAHPKWSIFHLLRVSLGF